MADIGLVANVATSLAVIFGILFGLVQWRQFERKRREAGAFEVLHALQSPEFIRAMHIIIRLPDGLGAKDLRARGSETAEAVEQAATILEGVAVMVHRGIVGIDVVDDLYGGFIRLVWRKLGPYFEEERQALGTPNFGEWVQWLAERLVDLDRPSKRVGAHVAFRDWKG